MRRKRDKNDFASGWRGFARVLRARVANASAGISCPRLAGPQNTIANRSFRLDELGWSMLVPVGEYPGLMIGPDGRKAPITQVLDREALESMAESFGGELLIDYEHFSHEPDKATTAAGWITAVQVRADGLYARNRWSRRGVEDLEGGNYRFISPEFEELEELSTGEVPRVRPRRLTGAGLTNRPQLKTLPPLSNRGSAATEKPTNDERSMKILNKILGLAEDAAENSAVEAVKTLQNRAGALQEERDTLKAERDALLGAQVEADLEQHKGVIKNRDAIKAALLKDRGATLAILESLQPAKEEGARLTNRETAKQPDTKIIAADAPSAEVLARTNKVRNRAHEIQRSDRCSWSLAWNKAEAEIPAAE